MDLKERNQNLKDFFNRKVDTYDDVHSKFMNTKQDLIDAIDKDAIKILDLGVGSGLELIYLFKIKENAKVTAIDLSDKMLEKLRTRDFGDKIKIICGDFFEVEFGKEYDSVISTSALHHFLVEDKLKLYKKVYKALKNNGEFINSDKVASSKKDERQLLEDYCLYKDEKAHCDTPLFIDTEVDLLKQVGFKEITIHDTPTENYKLIKARK